MLNFVKQIAKFLLVNTLYKPGTVATILNGDLKGYKYRVNENSGWSSIYGGWESEAQKAYTKFIKQDDIIYDLGANTGIHSILFAKLVGMEGQVYAFEPLSENTREIESIIELNSIKNITILSKAISNFVGTTNFFIGKHNKQGSVVGIGCETGTKVEVEVITLDELISKGLALPDFMKIDIEGAESLALEGFSQSITKCYPTFAIDLHTPQEDVKVAYFLKKYNYKFYRLKNGTAEKYTKQKELLVEIKNLDQGWPALDGVWGTVIAIHPSRQQTVQ
jgi:FkbM family methyltransferase